MYSEFVDREIETNNILKIINECKLNTAIITTSRTGIGKSVLSKKIMKNISDDFICFCIDTKPSNNNVNSFEGEYIRLLFNSLYEFYNPTDKKDMNFPKMSFKYFINHHCKKSTKKDIRNQQLNEIIASCTNKIGLVFVIICFFIKRMFGLDYYDFKKYTTDNTTQILSICSKYIEFILKSGCHFLCIDNFQNIDNLSFRYIQELMCNTLLKKNVFLFEYTLTEAENLERVIKIRDSLSCTGSNIVIYKLENMSPEYAYKAIYTRYPTISTMKEEIIEYYKYNACGNIRKIEDYVLCNVSDDKKTNFDPAIENISTLSNESKLLLSILSLHNGQISIDTIYNIFELSRDKFSHDIEYCLNETCKKYKMIIIKNNYLEFKHASILDAWKSYSINYPMHSYIAYRNLESYYSEVLKSKTKDMSFVLQILLELYLEFEPIKIYPLVSDIKSLVYSTISPQKAWTFMHGFINTLGNKINMFVSLLYQMIDWCCDFDLIYEAKYILDMIERDSEFEKNMRYNFCLCKINYLLGNYDVVISTAINNLEKAISEEEFLYYNLFLIIAYRSSNQYSKMQDIVDILSKDKKYNNCVVYGFFLRLAEVYRNKESSIKSIEDSIAFFEKNKLNYQMAKSYISLSYIYALNGKLDKATESIMQAKKVFGNDCTYSYMIKVNKACIMMLEGCVNSTVFNLLDSAENLVENDFNRLAIINNKIICCIEGINSQQRSYLTHRASELLMRVNDKHMHAIVNYNLYLLNREHEPDKAQKYYKTAESNHEHCKTLSIRLGKSKPDATSTFLLSKPWHVCFLSCWEMDYIIPQSESK